MNLRRSYYLLLGDVQRSTSRSSSERRTLFRKLDGAIERLNGNLDPEPVLGLTRSYGDEVAGLFEEPRRIYDVISELRDAIHPHSTLRFVVARGRVGVASDDITQVGGPVFKRANHLMDRVRKERRFCRWEVGKPAIDAALTSLSDQSNASIESMTPYQRRIFQLLREEMLQVDIAKKLRKHQQSVSEATKRGRADLVVDGEAAIRALLDS